MIADLIEGNERFQRSELFAKQRKEFVHYQDPATIIVTCADSRVAVEYIFSVKIGDVFEVENAGNILSDIDIESIQYALDHFNVKDIIVLCHENCGAVSAVYDAVKNKEKSKFKYQSVYKEIRPSIVTKYDDDKDNIIASIKKNCKHSAEVILKNTKPRKGHSHTIYTAYYNLKSGKVEFFN